MKNQGVELHSKRLRNIVYEIELVQEDEIKTHGKAYDFFQDRGFYSYKFKSLGYPVLYWSYEGKDSIKHKHGLVTPDFLRRNLLDERQWKKFCDGKRKFVMQQRINKQDVPLRVLFLPDNKIDASVYKTWKKI